jgi:hypothetical protein
MKDFINSNGEIWTADTDSFTLEIELDYEDGTFTAADKVLVTIKDNNFEKTFVEKLVNIEDNFAYFRMSVEDAKKIPAGDQMWSYSVLLNARALPGGGYTADEKITPFNGYRKYHVEEDPSNARN